MSDLTINSIMEALEGAGFSCSYDNSGGGVYCIYAEVIEHPVGAVGTVSIGTGDWTYESDRDAPEESVTVWADGRLDMVEVANFEQDGLWQPCGDLQAVMDAALDAADALRNVEDGCAECGGIFPMSNLTDLTRPGVDPAGVMVCRECMAASRA